MTLAYQPETPECLEMNGEHMNWSETMVLFISLKGSFLFCVPWRLSHLGMTSLRFGTGTASPQTSWESTVGTSLRPPSSLPAPCSTSSSPPTTPGRGQASPCAMRSSRRVSVLVGGKPEAGPGRAGGRRPSGSGGGAL